MENVERGYLHVGVFGHDIRFQVFSRIFRVRLPFNPVRPSPQIPQTHMGKKPVKPVIFVTQIIGNVDGGIGGRVWGSYGEWFLETVEHICGGGVDGERM